MSSSNNDFSPNKSKKLEPSSSTKIPILSRTSHNSLKHTYNRHGKDFHSQRLFKKPASQVKKVKHGGRRRTGMEYSLQSKDSLVDVTACLQGKRKEVMKLWQKTIPKGDPCVLSKIETANRLALEAAEEVETLRRTIQDLQRKEDGLSDSDCFQLEEMRVKVLEKVKEFEKADNLLQDIITQSESKTSLVSLISKPSQTEIECNQNIPLPAKRTESTVSTPHLPYSDVQQQQILAKKSHSSHEIIDSDDFIVLKEKSDMFSDESESDKDMNDIKEDIYEQGTTRDQEPSFSGKSTNAAVLPLPSLDNINRLKLFYEGSTGFPPMEEIIELTKSLSEESQYIKYQQQTGSKSREQLHPRPIVHNKHHRVKFTEGTEEKRDNLENEHWDTFPSIVNNDDMHRDKMLTLQRQLMNTEQEVEELKSEIERIESDANFRVRMLQNSVQDNFESLRIVPDYLQMVDQKLNETLQHKAKLQQALDSKDHLVSELKEDNKKFKQETEEIREQLRKTENCKDFLEFRNTELEKSNTELRRQVEELTKHVTEMTCQLQLVKGEPNPSKLKQDSWEAQKLKSECADLKEQHNQFKRIIKSLRNSKTKMICSLNQRVDDLMEALQKAQHHKRVLNDQIRYLKKSYNQFSVDMLTQQQQRKGTRVHRKPTNMNKPETIEVEEPLMQSTVAWQTGFGIKLDDLLRAPVPLQSNTHQKLTH